MSKFLRNCIIVQLYYFIVLNIKIFALLIKNEKEAHR